MSFTSFTENDLYQFQQQGVTHEQVAGQLELFKEGVHFLKLNKAATPDNGVLVLSAAEESRLLDVFERQTTPNCIKFTPASGAASRMFKSLFEAIGRLEKGNERIDEAVEQFFSDLSRFAFYDELKSCLSRDGIAIEEALRAKNYLPILKMLLYEQGMNYGNLPKGLLAFHRYAQQVRTPVEEHLQEAAHYARSGKGVARLHFTVSPEHRQAFERLLKRVVPMYEAQLGVRYEITFSEQKPSTDTVAVDNENQPFRNSDGMILFRPGGHGALIYNLNELDADMVFIKNIDNVVQERFAETTIRYKKILAGKLIELRQELFALQDELEKDTPGAGRMEKVVQLLEERYQYRLETPLDFTYLENARATLMSILDRPIRVCGVVKNTGEAGGGPFWAANSLGDVSLQIVEPSQVDPHDKMQQTLFTQSTHFNPVDLVCSLKNYKGEAFDLLQFVDPATCFISQKSKDGKELKALELPGLWNGAMADWISVFIEVPLETFNPVKTVNDLLRPMHQFV